MNQAQFKTYGFFYKNGQGEKCRKYLDIKAEGTTAPHPELIILMLSPGDCGEHKELELERDVEVQADPTLDRVKEFMSHRGLTWVRVLSLSDLEEKSSEAFFKKLGLLEKDALPEHSIFHPSRQEELIRHAKLETPFLLAWGNDKRKEALGNTVVARIKEQGYRIINEVGPHIHPLTRPTGGLPLWTEYADKLYRDFLAGKDKTGEQEERPASQHQQLQERRRTLEDKITSAFKFFINFEHGNPIITSAREGGRWALFAKLLHESGIRPYVGTEDYDYVFIDRVGNAEELYNLLHRHSGKKIVIDAATSPDILDKYGIIELLEGALCASPDNGEKWKVGLGCDAIDKSPFVFKGKLALLVNASKADLEKDERFEYLLRDTVVV